MESLITPQRTKANPEVIVWPRVTVVSVNYKQPELTRKMLYSLLETSYPDLEIILVDNETDGVSIPAMEKDFPEVRFLYSESNLGFAGGNNIGFHAATGKYILMLNNDTEVDPGFLEPMVEMMELNKEIGIVSPKIFFYDEPDTLQFAGTTLIHPITSRGRKFGYGEKDTGQHDLPRETGYANGACMMVRKEALDRIGGEMYEDYFLYYEEHDMTERIRQAGYRIMFNPAGKIFHKISAATGKMSPLKAFYLHRNRWVFIKRNQKGITRWLAQAYYLLIATPKAWLKYAYQGDNQRRKAIEKATAQALKGDMSRW